MGRCFRVYLQMLQVNAVFSCDLLTEEYDEQILVLPCYSWKNTKHTLFVKL